jgi:hypothetical protein
MSETFKVGDICVFVNSRDWPEYNGEECEIIGGLALRNIMVSRHGDESKLELSYKVRMLCDGELFGPVPDQLRRKRPPREDLQIVRWADCPWQPEGVRA